MSMNISPRQAAAIIAEALADGFKWTHPRTGRKGDSFAASLAARFNAGSHLSVRQHYWLKRKACEYQRALAEAAAEAEAARKAEAEAETCGEGCGGCGAEAAAAEVETPRTIAAEAARKAAELKAEAEAAEVKASDAAEAAEYALRISVALRADAAEAEAEADRAERKAQVWDENAPQRALEAAEAARKAEAEAEIEAETARVIAEQRAAAEAETARLEAVARFEAEKAAKAEAEAKAEASRQAMQGPLSILDLAVQNGAKRPQLLLNEPGQREVRLRAFDPNARGGRWLLQRFPSLVDGGALLGGKVKGRAHAVLTPDGDIRMIGRWGGRAAAEAVEALNQFALDPERRGAELGKMHGSCIFCRLPLSDPRSTTAGYGPVCAGHYNLTWGDKPGATLEDRRKAYQVSLAARRLERAEARMADERAAMAAEAASHAEAERKADAAEAELKAVRARRVEAREAREAEARKAEADRRAAAEAEAAEGQMSAAELRARGMHGEARIANLDLD